MNFAVDHMFRLAPRGGAGLSCDEIGVALGAADLARVHREPGGRRRCEVRPPAEVGRVLKAAYGPQPDAVVQRLHRGLNRTARWLEAGDLCHAGVEAVMLGFPDLTPTAMAKLAELADLEKRGAPWEDEPRLPAGQAGGGQWTTDGGGGGGNAASAKPVRVISPAETIEPTGPAAPAPPTTFFQPPLPVAWSSGNASGVTLNDGVYRPGADRSRAFAAALPPEIADDAAEILAGRGAEEEGELPLLENELPVEIGNVKDLFPRLEEHPSEIAPFRAPDPFGVAGYAYNLPAAEQAKLYFRLQAETKAVDPHYNDQGYFPDNGFASLSEADRTRLINEVLLDRATAYYNFDNDPRQLQIETLRFLRKTVDHYYAEAVEKYEAKQLDKLLSREEAIGNYVDKETRQSLQRLFNQHDIPYGRGQGVAINNRDYDTSQPGKPPSGRPPYRVPDLRIGDPRIVNAPMGEVRIRNLTIDWTISMKQPKDAQIQGFFNADSKPKAVVIVVPSQRYDPGTYYIPRAASLKGN